MMQLFVQQLLNGLATGSQYALWAVGYGLVYQVLGLMHFAHGDTMLVGLYIAFALFVTLSLPIYVALPLVVLFVAILAVIVERGVYRPLVKRGDTISAFIAALGAAYILRNLVILGWGSAAKAFPHVIPETVIEVGGLYLNSTPLVTLATAIAVVTGFTMFLKRTKHGQAILALAQDRETAALMGIPTSRMISAIYALSGIIGIIGALLFMTKAGGLRTTIGFFMTLKAFVAAIIGGIGRIEGAVLGGLLLGVLEALVISYVSSLYSQAIVFSLLGLMLIVRPSGLFGREEVVKF